MLPLYLDHNATTPLHPEVVEAMLPYLTEHFGNPSSGHPFGRRAKQGVERAREQIAAFLGASPGELLFTSGGTEANNLALRGHLAAITGRPRIVTSTIEHPATEEPCRALEASGAKVARIGVDARGIVDLAALKESLDAGTALVTVMHSNNETGALQPIREIVALARQHGVAVHTDAAQSLGKVRVDVNELGVDLLSVAGHKLHAPKGVGVLYVRSGTALAPLLRGASHERGLRPGTENVASIVGLGAACEALRELPTARLSALTQRLLTLLQREIPGLTVNGPVDAALRLPNTLNVSAPRVLGRRWLERTPELAASTGSACHDGHDAPSAVLSAMGLSREQALGAVRLSLGRSTTEAEVDLAAAALIRSCHSLQKELP